MVRGNPGISTSEARGKLGSGWSTVYRCLRTSEAEGEIFTRREGRNLRIFPTSQRPEFDLASVLRSAVAREIAQAIVTDPGSHDARTLARLAKVTPSAVRGHLRGMRALKFITSAKAGRYIQLRPSPQLERALDRRSEGLP